MSAAQKQPKPMNIDAMNGDLIMTYLDRFSIAIADTSSALERAVALSDHFREQVDQKKIAAADVVQCDACNGFSPTSLDECPYCGEKGVEGADEPASSQIVKAEPSAPIVKTTSAKVKATAKVKAAKAGKSKPEEPASPATEVVHAVVRTEKDLDRAVEKVKRLNAGMVRNAWELGNELRQIHAEKLYLQRVDASGAPKHKTWSQFVTKELDLTPSYTHSLMDISAAFTQTEVEKIAVRKLRMIVQVPKEYQAELTRRASEGATQGELAESVAEIMEGRPARDTGRAGFRAGTEKVDARDARAVREQKKAKDAKAKDAKVKKTKAAAAKGAADRPADAITVVLARRTKVKLYKAKLDRDGKKARAMRVLDDASGTVDLYNNTKLHVHLRQDAAGALEVIVTVERPGASS